MPEYLAQRNERLGVSWRTRLLAGLPIWLHRYRRPLSGSIRLRGRLPWLARLVDATLGIAARRPLPFPVPATTGERGEVLLFVDTFSHHFEPEVAEDAIAVLNRAGFRVRVAGPAAGDAEPARPLCCGRTYLSNGLVEQARHEARRTLDALGGRHSHRRPGAFVFIPDCPLAILVGVKASREGLERMSGRAGSNGYH